MGTVRHRAGPRAQGPRDPVVLLTTGARLDSGSHPSPLVTQDLRCQLFAHVDFGSGSCLPGLLSGPNLQVDSAPHSWARVTCRDAVHLQCRDTAHVLPMLSFHVVRAL